MKLIQQNKEEQFSYVFPRTTCTCIFYTKFARHSFVSCFNKINGGNHEGLVSKETVVLRIRLWVVETNNVWLYEQS